MGRKPKSPSEYRWTVEKEKVLTWWEEHELLYNLEVKDYSNQQKKRRIFEEIAAEMGATGNL